MNEYVKFFTEQTFGLISNIIWPICILIIFAIIKKPLFEILKNIKKIKYADLEAEISSISESINEVTNECVNCDTKNPIMEDMVKENPNIAIVSSWMKLEQLLREKFNQIYPTSDKHYLVRDMMNQLVQDNKLPRQFLHIVYRLSAIRNYAIHGEGVFTQEDAQDFVNNIERIIFYIEKNIE